MPTAAGSNNNSNSSSSSSSSIKSSNNKNNYSWSSRKKLRSRRVCSTFGVSRRQLRSTTFAVLASGTYFLRQELLRLFGPLPPS